jgi:hypothetical protein
VIRYLVDSVPLSASRPSRMFPAVSSPSGADVLLEQRRRLLGQMTCVFHRLGNPPTWLLSIQRAGRFHQRQLRRAP